MYQTKKLRSSDRGFSYRLGFFEILENERQKRIENIKTLHIKQSWPEV